MVTELSKLYDIWTCQVKVCLFNKSVPSPLACIMQRVRRTQDVFPLVAFGRPEARYQPAQSPLGLLIKRVHVKEACDTIRP